MDVWKWRNDMSKIKGPSKEPKGKRDFLILIFILVKRKLVETETDKLRDIQPKFPKTVTPLIEVGN